MLIIAGACSHLFIMFRYGQGTFGGIYRAHDETWHMALAQISFRTWPLQTPIYSGAPLTGYHYLSSFLMVPFLLLSIPSPVIFYWILPVVWFVLFTYLTWKLARALHPSYSFALSLLFFNYFAGSFSYLIRLRNGVGLWDHSAHYMHQSSQYLMNFPLAWSLLPVLGILLLFAKNKWPLWRIVIFIALIVAAYGFKFYAGITVSLLIGFFYFLQILKKNWGALWLLLLGIGASIGALIFFYNPLASLSTGSIFSFVPLATAHMTIEDTSYFHLPDLVLQRYYLYEHGVGPRLIAIESLTILLTIFFSFGTRIIGVVAIGRLIFKKLFTALHASIAITIFVLIVFSMTLVQKGDWFNTAQFASYGMLLMNIFAAYTLFWVVTYRRKTIAILATLLIGILTIHSSIDTFIEYGIAPKIVYVSRTERAALEKLKNEPYGTVFIPLHLKLQGYLASDPTPVELWKTYDTAYVAAYTGKPLWFADKGQLAVTGVASKKREQVLGNLSKLGFVENGIRYIYIQKSHPLAGKFSDKAIRQKYKKIFENTSVVIFSYPGTLSVGS